MKTKIIGIKQLQQNLKTVSNAAFCGQSFLVVKNSKPIFKIDPVTETSSKKYTFKDFKKLQFSSDKNLSKEMDKNIYQ